MSIQSPVQLDARTLSFEEFLEAYDGVHAEWVDGRVQVMSPGNERQSTLTGFLVALLQFWADTHDLGRAYVPPFPVRLGARTAREPDVFFVRTANLGSVQGTFVDGPVDLAIEIPSPSTRGTDRGDKFYQYEEAAIPEYWMIDPVREQVDAYRLSDGGRYERVALGDPPVLRSESLPGMKIPVEWLWQSPPPRLPAVIREWGLT